MKIIILLLSLISTLCMAQYKIAIDQNYISQSNTLMISDLKEAYRRIGINASVEILPGFKAVRLADKGEFQALDARFLGNESLSNMVVVNEPIFTSMQINAYSVKDFDTIESYNDLEPYLVAFPRGMQIYKKIMELVPDLHTFIAPNYNVLVSALDNNRADIIVISHVAYKLFFQNQGITHLKKINDEPLEVLHLYHFVHKSQSHLAPRLAKVIAQMKQEGFFAPMH